MAALAAGKIRFDAFAVGVLVGTKTGHRFFGPSPAAGARALDLALPRLTALRLLAELSLRTDASMEEIRDLGYVLSDASAMLDNLDNME